MNDCSSFFPSLSPAGEESYYNNSGATANGSLLSAVHNNSINQANNSINATTYGTAGNALISQQSGGGGGGGGGVPSSISVQQFNATSMLNGSSLNQQNSMANGGVLSNDGASSDTSSLSGGVPHSQSAPQQLSVGQQQQQQQGGQQGQQPLTPLAQHHQALAQQLQQRFAISNNNGEYDWKIFMELELIKKKLIKLTLSEDMPRQAQIKRLINCRIKCKLMLRQIAYYKLRS